MMLDPAGPIAPSQVPDPILVRAIVKARRFNDRLVHKHARPGMTSRAAVVPVVCSAIEDHPHIGCDPKAPLSWRLHTRVELVWGPSGTSPVWPELARR